MIYFEVNHELKEQYYFRIPRAAGRGEEEIIQEFPDLKKRHIAASQYYARDLTEFEVVV